MTKNSSCSDVAIIGAGLTGLSLAYLLKNKGLSPCLLEKQARVGGVIQTHRQDDFVFESGPNSGVLASVELAELLAGLQGELSMEKASPLSRFRWVYCRGSWQALPSSPLSFLKTPLFSARDKLNLLLEPFRARGKNQNESLAQLVERRLGSSFLDYAIDPFVLGIYAGDPAGLVTRHAFPKLHRLEAEFGSFIKGSLIKMKRGKTAREKQATREVFSFVGGLEKLIETLASKVGNDAIHTGISGVKILPRENGHHELSWISASGEMQHRVFRHIILTTAIDAWPELLPSLSVELNPLVENLIHAPVVQLALGWKRWQGMELAGFGGLIPFREKRDILGALFMSSLFKNRAPVGGALLSVFMGGVRRPDIIKMSDEQISAMALNEVKALFAEDAAPDCCRLFRYPRAIPQYGMETEARLDQIKSIEQRYPGLVLAGQCRDGIGIANRVAQARHLSEENLA